MKFRKKPVVVEAIQFCKDAVFVALCEIARQWIYEEVRQ